MSSVTFIVMSGGLSQWQRNKHEENKQFSSPVIGWACYRSCITIEQFESFGEGAQRYIAGVYQSNNLTGELLNLSQKERQWIKNHPELKVGIDPNSLPYEALSVMDDFEATRKIREFDMQVPIIAMSANVFADAKQRARDAGVTDFLDKPIIIDEASSLLIKYIVPEVMVEGKAAPLTDQVVSSAENDDHSIDDNSEKSPVFSKQRFEQLTQSDVELQDKLLRKFDNSATCAGWL